MNPKHSLFLTVLIIAIIFLIGCVPQQQTKTPNAEKVNTTQTNQATAKDDFGCWPPSCSVIPDPQGKKLCEDWKAGKKVQWPDCSIYSSIQPSCTKLCESEKKGAASGKFPSYPGGYPSPPK